MSDPMTTPSPMTEAELRKLFEANWFKRYPKDDTDVLDRSQDGKYQFELVEEDWQTLLYFAPLLASPTAQEGRAVADNLEPDEISRCVICQHAMPHGDDSGLCDEHKYEGQPMAWLTPGGDVYRSRKLAMEFCWPPKQPQPLYLSPSPSQSVPAGLAISEREQMLAALRTAETLAYKIACDTDVGPARERAFAEYENIRTATRIL